MIQRIVKWILKVWLWLCGKRRKSRGPHLARPLTTDITEATHLSAPEDIRYPLQDLFRFPIQETQVSLDANVWGSLRLSLPSSYAIPDPDFTRVLAVTTSMRSLRWTVGDIDPEICSVTLGWNYYRTSGSEARRLTDRGIGYNRPLIACRSRAYQSAIDERRRQRSMQVVVKFIDADKNVYEEVPEDLKLRIISRFAKQALETEFPGVTLQLIRDPTR